MRYVFRTILIFSALLMYTFSHAETTKVQPKSVEIFDHLKLPELDKVQKSLDDFIDQLAERKGKYKNDESFIRYVFHRTHNKYLKNYTEQANIYQLFTEGNYDCLTGTVLYMMIFEKLGYEYQVVELDYHIYLLINSEGKTYGIESTDPFNGIRISGFDVDQFKDHSENKDHYQYKESIFNTVDTGELIGLLYFNQAVKAYNVKKFSQAYSILQVAKKHYPSARMDEFEVLIRKELLFNGIASVQ